MLLKFDHGHTRERFCLQVLDQQRFDEHPRSADLACRQQPQARKTLRRFGMHLEQGRGFRQVECAHGSCGTVAACRLPMQPAERTISMERAAGSGNIYVAAGSTYPAFILVEDIG